MIPQNIKSAIDEYVDHGHSVGHFLKAVLSNDLFSAVVRADADSLLALHEICIYILNYTPAPCWGSNKIINDWIKLHKENPVTAERIAYGDRNNRRDYKSV